MQYLILCLLVLVVIASMSTTAQKNDSSSGSISGSGTGGNIFAELFGPTLYKWKINSEESTMQVDEFPTADLLKDKTAVAIYFSASWCGPCKKFTPVLAQLYTKLNKKGKKFEVIWISRDRSQDEFLQYYQQMPWLAVTLDNLEGVLQKLAPKYQLKGIPHLVILDGDDASIISLDGRTLIAKDQHGLEYPWRPRTLLSILPKPLKRLIKAQLDKLVSSLRSTLQGVLDSLAPAKVINWLTKKVTELLAAGKEQAAPAQGKPGPSSAQTQAQRQQQQLQQEQYRRQQQDQQQQQQAQQRQQVQVAGDGDYLDTADLDADAVLV